MIYTGAISDAFYISVESEPTIKFIYGTVIYDLSKRFNPGDWIATSYLTKFREVDNGFAAITQNSIYYIDNYQTIDIPFGAVDNIRLGTPPDVALKLLRGEWPNK
jgi:hypothetical protein